MSFALLFTAIIFIGLFPLVTTVTTPNSKTN